MTRMRKRYIDDCVLNAARGRKMDIRLTRLIGMEWKDKGYREGEKRHDRYFEG